MTRSTGAGEADGGLVQQQDARLGHQRHADGEHLLLAAGQGAADLAAAFAQQQETAGIDALKPLLKMGRSVISKPPSSRFCSTESVRKMP